MNFKKFQKKAIFLIGLIASSTVLLLGFQNCGTKLSFKSVDTGSSTLSSTLSSTSSYSPAIGARDVASVMPERASVVGRPVVGTSVVVPPVVVTAPVVAASCQLDGQTIPSGGVSGALYSVASVPFGSVCPEAVERTCMNGVLSNPQSVHSTCTAQSQPTCTGMTFLNTTTMKCETCKSGETWSLSQKACFSSCPGGIVVRMRNTNIETVETVQNPISFNLGSGFTLNRDGIDYVVGRPGPSSTFVTKMNLAVTQKSEYQGVREAYQAGINEVAGLSGISVTLGDVFYSIVAAGPEPIHTKVSGRDIVMTGPGNFKMTAYQSAGSESVYTGASASYFQAIYCK